MTYFEQLKLQQFRKTFPGIVTPLEALEEALHMEKVKLDCGPFDPVAGRFSENQRLLEEMALLLEKENLC